MHWNVSRGFSTDVYSRDPSSKVRFYPPLQSDLNVTLELRFNLLMYVFPLASVALQKRIEINIIIMVVEARGNLHARVIFTCTRLHQT